MRAVLNEYMRAAYLPRVGHYNAEDAAAYRLIVIFSIARLDVDVK